MVAQRYDAALDHFISISETQGCVSSPMVWRGLGRAYHHLGRYRDAITAFKKANELSPDLPVHKRNLAGAYLSAAYYGDTQIWEVEKAAAILEALLSENPEIVRDRYNLAHGYEILKKYEPMIRNYTDVISDGGRLAPSAAHNLGLHFSMVASNCSDPQTQRALSLFKKAIDLESSKADKQARMSSILSEELFQSKIKGCTNGEPFAT